MYTKNMNRYLDPRISCEYDKSEIRVEEETKKKPWPYYVEKYGHLCVKKTRFCSISLIPQGKASK